MDERERDLLRRAAPVHDADLDTPEIRTALATLGAAIPDEPAGRRRGSRTRMVIIGVGVTAAMAVAAPAAAAALGLWSGHFGSPESTEEDGSEYLNVESAEFPAFARGLVAHLPLPPGENLDHEIATIARVGGLMQDQGIAGQLALNAACTWTGTWLAAHEDGDETGMAAASRVLDAIPTWPEIVTVDGGGVVDALRVRAEGARAGDPSSFRAEYDLNCLPLEETR